MDDAAPRRQHGRRLPRVPGALVALVVAATCGASVAGCSGGGYVPDVPGNSPVLATPTADTVASPDPTSASPSTSAPAPEGAGTTPPAGPRPAPPDGEVPGVTVQPTTTLDPTEIPGVEPMPTTVPESEDRPPTHPDAATVLARAVDLELRTLKEAGVDAPPSVLTSLPQDAAGAVGALAGYAWTSPEARDDYELAARLVSSGDGTS